MRLARLATILLAASAATPSLAEGPPADARLCAERARLLSQLSTKFDESPIGIGLTSAGGVMELLSSQKGRTWTLIVTRPDGLSCLFAAGEGWEPVARARIANEIRY